MEIEDSILEEQYCINSQHINADVECTRELMKKTIELQNELYLTMTEEQKKIYLDIEEITNHKISLIRKNVFKYAFRLGIQHLSVK